MEGNEGEKENKQRERKEKEGMEKVCKKGEGGVRGKGAAEIIKPVLFGVWGRGMLPMGPLTSRATHHQFVFVLRLCLPVDEPLRVAGGESTQTYVAVVGSSTRPACLCLDIIKDTWFSTLHLRVQENDDEKVISICLHCKISTVHAYLNSSSEQGNILG